MGADAAAFAAAHDAGNVDFGTRFCKGEVAGPEADFRIFAEDVAKEVFEHALEVGEANVLIDDHAFHLMEDRRMGRIVVAAIYLAGSNDLKGFVWLMGLEGPGLHP